MPSIITKNVTPTVARTSHSGKYKITKELNLSINTNRCKSSIPLTMSELEKNACVLSLCFGAQVSPFLIEQDIV